MTTTINNTERVFQILSSTGGQWFCSLKDISSIIRENNLIDGYYKVNHFWDNKPKRASKKLIADMQKAAGLNPNNIISTIDIKALEWFDKVNGNSYFAGYVTINVGLSTEKQFKMPFQYGYGDSYIQEAIKTLQENGLLPKEYDYNYFTKHGIITRTSKHENCKKAELKNI